MRPLPSGGPSSRAKRIAWADTAKGVCIVLVVMLYAAEHISAVTGNAGWLEAVEAFARPFRMPDFFLISGVLLTLSIGRDWHTFFDRKVVHFAYFYVLWVTILVAFASPWIAEDAGWPAAVELYLRSFGRPYSMLWFIYMLPIFFVVTKALQRVPVLVVWTCAAALQVAHIDSDIKVWDKFTGYYVFFYSGYVLAPRLVQLADAAVERPRWALAALTAWAIANTWLVYTDLAFIPGLSLPWALIGAGAVVVASALMAGRRPFAPLAYCGRNTLPIYLAFAIPLAVASKLLFMSGVRLDPGSIAALATLAAVTGALVLERLVRGTAFGFLFERPAWLKLQPVASAKRRPAGGVAS